MFKKVISLFLILCMLVPGAGTFAEEAVEPADLIVYGKIYTADAEGTVAEALCVKDGKYVYVGDLKGASRYLSGSTETATGTFILPGATDAHAHRVLAEALRLGLLLEPFDENNEFYAVDHFISEITAYAAAHPEKTAIYGYGWDIRNFSTKLIRPNRALLDAAFPDIPVYLSDVTLHNGWCNTKCLELAGALTDEIPTAGVERDENGVATGYIQNEACDYVINSVFDALADYDTAVLNAQAGLNAQGYTMTMEGWGNFDGSAALIDAVKDADDAGKLTAVIYTSYALTSYDDEDTGIAIASLLHQTHAGAHSDMRYLKLFADGIETSFTAYLLEPYLDGSHGTRTWSDARMTDIVKKANAEGLLVQIHAYGDASARQAIDAYETSAAANGKLFRNSIAHAPYVAESDLDRIAALDISVAGSGNWAVSLDKADTLVLTLALGARRYADYYLIDAFPAHGIPAGVSTDKPCVDGFCGGYAEDIFDYLGVLVTGIDYRPGKSLPPRRDNWATVEDGLRMLTINGAHALDTEQDRGSIEVGKYADFVIASADPFETAPEKIHTIDVLGTWFEGNNVYTKEGVILTTNGLPAA